MARPDMIREMVKAVKAGGRDYLAHPLDPDEIQLVTEDICEFQHAHFPCYKLFSRPADPFKPTLLYFSARLQKKITFKKSFK